MDFFFWKEWGKRDKSACFVLWSVKHCQCKEFSAWKKTTECMSNIAANILWWFDHFLRWEYPITLSVGGEKGFFFFFFFFFFFCFVFFCIWCCGNYKTIYWRWNVISGMYILCVFYICFFFSLFLSSWISVIKW